MSFTYDPENKINRVNNHNKETKYMYILPTSQLLIKPLRDFHLAPRTLCVSIEVSMTMVCFLWMRVSWGNPYLGPVPGPRNLPEHRDAIAQQTAPSAWFIDYSPAGHTHTQRRMHTRKGSHMNTYAHVGTRRWKIYLKECGARAHKKMRSGRCVRTEIRYESVYQGGRNSFDMIRMVAKKKQ